jgi:hypothetical protein
MAEATVTADGHICIQVVENGTTLTASKADIAEILPALTEFAGVAPSAPAEPAAE